jgi:hypothetical protein
MPQATAGWEQWAGKPQPQIAIHRPVSRLFFFSLSTFNVKTTELHLHAEKLTETLLHLNLGHLVGFVCVCVCSFILLYVSLWWDSYRRTSEALSQGLDAEGRTPKLLRLKFHCIWTWRFLFFIFYFVLFYCILYIYMYIYIYFFHLLFKFLFLSLLFLFFIFNPLLSL